MKLEKIFKNIEKQNKLRKELGQKELVFRCTLFHEQYQFKTYKDFYNLLTNEVIDLISAYILCYDFSICTVYTKAKDYDDFEFIVEEE